MKSELFREIIKFTAMYKQCRANCKNCTVKEVTALAKSIHYFHYDMTTLLTELEEEVAEDKTDPEPIKASTIEDYAKKSKQCRELLKAVKFSRDKQSASCKVLDDLIDNTNNSKVCLEKLRTEIIKVVKKQGKDYKPDKDIEKLTKQIDADLKEIDAILAQVKKIPKINRTPDTEYAIETKRIVKVKPKMSGATQKFNKIWDQKLKPKALKKTEADFEKEFKVLVKFAEETEKAAQKEDVRALTASFQKGQKVLQTIESIADEHFKFRKKFLKQIQRAQVNKGIEKKIKLIINRKNDAVKRWETTGEIIKKASKK